MKTIYFIRHGKSSWENTLLDVDRPLNKLGVTDAKHIGQKLLEKEIEFDAIYSSIAKRAKSTATIVASQLGIDSKQILLRDKLYNFDSDKIVSFIKEIPNDQKNVLIFGHNPAFTSVINTYGSIQFDNLPTCGVVALEFDIKNWQSLNNGITTFYLLPKLLGYNK